MTAPGGKKYAHTAREFNHDQDPVKVRVATQKERGGGGGVDENGIRLIVCVYAL